MFDWVLNTPLQKVSYLNTPNSVRKNVYWLQLNCHTLMLLVVVVYWIDSPPSFFSSYCSRMKYFWDHCCTHIKTSQLIFITNQLTDFYEFNIGLIWVEVWKVISLTCCISTSLAAFNNICQLDVSVFVD